MCVCVKLCVYSHRWSQSSQGNNDSCFSLRFPFLTHFNPSFIHAWQVCVCVCVHVGVFLFVCVKAKEFGNSCSIVHRYPSHLPSHSLSLPSIFYTSVCNPPTAYKLGICCLFYIFLNLSCSINCNRITPLSLLDYVTLLSTHTVCITHTHTCMHTSD